jgi:hypothetical protein
VPVVDHPRASMWSFTRTPSACLVRKRGLGRAAPEVVADERFRLEFPEDSGERRHVEMDLGHFQPILAAAVVEPGDPLAPLDVGVGGDVANRRPWLSPRKSFIVMVVFMADPGRLGETVAGCTPPLYTTYIRPSIIASLCQPK